MDSALYCLFFMQFMFTLHYITHPTISAQFGDVITSYHSDVTHPTISAQFSDVITSYHGDVAHPTISPQFGDIITSHHSDITPTYC